MELIVSNDDISDDVLDFGFTVTLEAGHKYYIGYRANQVNVSGEAVINIGGTQTPNSSAVGDCIEIDTIEVTQIDGGIHPPSGQL